jgi:Ca2+-binding RTX toxin-like protein
VITCSIGRRGSGLLGTLPHWLFAAALCAIGALLALPAFASANTTISYSSTQNKLLVSTDGGESNYISASQTGNTYTFSEDGFNDTTFSSLDLIETASQCTRLTSPTLHVDCTVANLSFIDVNLGTGDFDGFDASDLVSDIPHPVSTAIVADGGNGDDYVLGGTGNDTLTGGTGDDDLEGDAGNDTIDAGDDDDSYIDGGTGDDTIDGGQGGDYLVGGEGDDRLTGGNGDDSYEGDDGNDTFVSGSVADGADSIDDFGDVGTDTADYSTRLAALSLSNNDDFDDGAVATSGEDGIGNRDEIASDVEVMIGGSGADTLAGVGLLGNGPNVLRGNLGNDTLTGTEGVVADTADYSNAPSAVTVNLAAGAATGGAGTDTLTAIENAYGSPSADTLTGSGSDNLLRGNAGDDFLTGAAGNDTVDYANATSAVTINLAAANPHSTGAAGSDTIGSMESVNGGSADDALTGDSGANTLRGSAGNDTLTGAAGHDAVAGGDGNDNLQVRDTEDDGPLSCDAGTDSVTADGIPLDATGPDCETVDRGGGGPPIPPTLTDTDPDSPANNNSPVVKGTAVAGTTVRLYANATCTGSPLATGAAAAFASPGLTVAVADNSTTSFHATATNGVGTSACSSGVPGSITYVEDSAAPETTIVGGPSGNISDNTPTFDFSSNEAGASFECRIDSEPFAGCSSPFTAAPQGEGAHSFQVRATDAAGNTDSTPDARAFKVEKSTNDTLVTGKTVKLVSSSNPANRQVTFASTDKTIALGAGNGSPDDPTNSDVSVRVVSSAFDNTYTMARAGWAYIGIAGAGKGYRYKSATGPVKSAEIKPRGLKVSAKGAGLGHLLAGTPDSVAVVITVGDQRYCTTFGGKTKFTANKQFSAANAPRSPSCPPTITETDPASPANNNAPKVRGRVAAGTSVSIYKTADCSGAALASGSAEAFASPGLTVSVPDDATTVLRARATDLAGHSSVCSGAFSYVEDSSAPTPPTFSSTAPASPANDNSPKIVGTAASGTTVRLYKTSDCSGAPMASGGAATFASPGLTVSVADDTTTVFHATATDGASNVSDCSSTTITYAEDSTPPDTTITAGPTGTINDATPSFEFSSSESGSDFACRVDSESFAPCSSTHTTAALTDGAHSFEVRATDQAGNVDPSPASRAFNVELTIDTLIKGKNLRLSSSSNAAYRRLTVFSRDIAVNLGAGNGSADDPVLQGATVRVLGTGIDFTYALPAAGWTYIGAAGQGKGYRYADSAQVFGPIRSAQLRQHNLTISGLGAALGYNLATDPGSVSIVTRVNIKRYCMNFGGSKKFSAGSSFKGINSPAPSVCP